MSKTHIRLNLAIRRNGLPEAKVVWPVSLEENPTVSKLLEQVNDIIPLESSDWGLEDYAVELTGPDGSNFECLHFQPVRAVLKEGDQVRIRPLLTNDLKQRRISGRHQVSRDGKHLVDGIPFGRPLLKMPRGRPSLDIPPRKRRRVAIEEGPDEDEHSDHEEPEQDEPMLLLTNGEENPTGAKRVTINTEPQYFGNKLGDEDEDDDDDDSDFEEDQMDEESDLEEEDEADESHDEGQDDNMESQQQDSAQEEASSPPGSDEKEEGTSPDQPPDQPTSPNPKDLSSLDDSGLLHAAFPKITVFCDNMLQKYGGNLDLAYKALRKISEPVLPRDEFEKRTREKSSKQKESAEDAIPSQVSGKGRVPPNASLSAAELDDEDDQDDDEDDQDDDEADDEVDDFVKKFDRRGLPAGSISTTSTPGNAKNHIVFEEPDDSTAPTPTTRTGAQPGPKPSGGDSDDSSSDSQSESSDSRSDSDSDSGPEETSATRNDKPASGGKGAAKPDSDVDTSSSDEDSSDSSDEGSDEEQSSSEGSDDDNDDENSDSESDDEEFAPGSGGNEADSTSESDSDDSSSDSEPEEESSRPKSQSVGNPPLAKENLASSDTTAQPTQISGAANQSHTPIAPEQLNVPPGSGKQSTKQRNARRRLAARNKRSEAQGPDAGTEQAEPTSQAESQKSKQDAEKELFEAKRKALLDALNSGGAVIGRDGELEVDGGDQEAGDTTTISQKSNKRRRGDRSTPEPAVGESGDKSAATPASQETDPEASAQKRRRVDLGAGRRMLFGALGLRNPKTKEDESALRAKLMENVRPLPNSRLESNAAENAESLAKDTATDPEALEEDPDAWRNKIEYSAVECWYDGVELSEPPFPFEQRWDPQQRGNRSRKGKKRGGGEAGNDQDQEGETSFAGKKRKHDESVQMEDDSYYSYQGQAGSQDENLQLNYDDVEPEQADKTDHQQTENSIDEGNYSDLDDLPSLPKDLGVLRQLQPGQAQVGMVITWKQFILSQAVNWQPQVMDLTGLVTEIYGDDAFEVILAKRDRHLERPEKQYDEHTGKRIYGRFEVPDDDEDADDENEDSDEDDRRKLSFSVMDGYTTMMDPRVRQDPMTSVLETSPLAQRQADVTMENSADEVANPGDASEDQNDAGDGTTYSTFETTMDSRMDSGPAAVEVEEPHPTQEENSLTNGPSNSSNGQPGQGHRFINVPLSDISQITSSSQRVSRSPEPRQGSHQSAADLNVPSSDGVEPDLPDGGPTTPTREQSSVPTTHFNDTNGDILTGTPQSAYPKVIVRPSSASSDHSGRQPDFATTTTDTPEPDFKDTTEGERGRFEVSDQQQSVEEENDLPLPPAYSPITEASSAADALEEERGEDSDASFSSIPSLGTVLRESSQRSSQWFSSQEPPHRQSQRPPDLSSENEEFADSFQELPEEPNADQDSNIIPDSFQTAPQSKPVADTSSMVGGESDVHKMLMSSQGRVPASQGRASTDISPPPVQRKTKSISPFIKQRNSPPMPSSSMRHSIPPGTQIVEISSDSSDDEHFSDSQSEHFEENYVDDEYDETWNPDESTALPDGSGWVQKKLPEKNFSATDGRDKKPRGGRRLGYSASQPVRSVAKPRTAASVYKNRVKTRRAA